MSKLNCLMIQCLTLLLFQLTISSAQAEGNNARRSFGNVVNCETKELRFKIEPASTPEQRTQGPLVLVSVLQIESGRTDRFIAQDNTDPWESSWPAFSGRNFTFFSQEAGRPQMLIYLGKDLSREASCVF